MTIEAKNLVRELKKIISQTTKRETVKVITDAAAKELRSRTKSGYGAEHNKPKRRLQSLRKSTINVRKNLKAKGKLTGEGAIPEKSNITRSGLTLDSIRTKSLKGVGEIKIKKPEPKRRVKALERLSKGFTFFNLSSEEQKDILEKVKKVVDVAIRKFNNT